MESGSLLTLKTFARSKDGNESTEGPALSCSAADYGRPPWDWASLGGITRHVFTSHLRLCGGGRHIRPQRQFQVHSDASSDSAHSDLREHGAVLY
ncbi:MAG: hypothetical protein JWM99_541 [Verrucomicrobiales bacterium]|jgi:hypothetical protein|nr:hypothetical protein [Verrucomicrobiales bacterium]